jgi:hypothetical protein
MERTSEGCNQYPFDSFSLEPKEFQALVKDTNTAWSPLGNINYEKTETELGNITTLFVLPHSSFIESSSFNVENYKKHVAEHMQKQSEIVGIKYHPRQIADPLHFSTLKVTEIPRHVPLEMFLPIMNIKHAYGDIFCTHVYKMVIAKCPSSC